ncbi:MAG: oligopeptide transporter, OPT family [Pseudomonadota bacterium]|nr:oligopeptide transporter, OPT family [Gammaproteobacteria bacterium]MBU1558731.1 oligopeptide transporter, OPT family [Gammaproteobacteria bacterium]MBU1628699.1 oligopeptide transporter, OPT family [Gammaproteobacteria bacterium]MBU1927280.1 oligopeptide transporter, OPT family [Gammaproteobacteria bacterium]MBU2546341.1 oligopeptide transporter, OPT family [Gammaproteobacteria bacterium]
MSSRQPSVVSKKDTLEAQQSLPEFTVKGVVLSVLLIVLLTASDAFLGLKVGTTISAAIPAVVLSMGIFRFFGQQNPLEINVVQTAASVAEGIAAGIIFTLPALLILHFWTKFNYLETVGIAALGGILGVLFSIPLRRALLADKTLQFPEGTAVGHVMKAGADQKTSLKPLLAGGGIGALISLFQTGFGILANSYYAWFIRGRLLFGGGIGFSPAVIAAGFICGVNVAISLLVGILIGWVFGIPILSLHYGIPLVGHAADTANQFWLDYVRYIGVGTMLIGGVWTLIVLVQPVTQGIVASFESLKEIRAGRGHLISRTDRDIPIHYMLWGILLLLLLIAAQFFVELNPAVIQISSAMHLTITVMTVVYVLIAGFVFSSVSAYFAGLVGSTNSPGSGLMIAAELIFAFMLLLLLQHQIHFNLEPAKATYMASFVVIVCALVGSGVIMANESVQGLKAGQIIGGTPWKQQLTLVVGVVIAAMVIPLILNLLYNAYGIGGVFPHPGMPKAQMLAAPQAGLMAAVAQGVFSHQLPWNMVLIGMGIAIVCIFIDEFAKRSYGLRLPVLAIGLGIYLPLEASAPIVIGGILSYIAKRSVYYNYRKVKKEHRPRVREGMNNAILLACGLVAGSTLMGVGLAIPFAIRKSADALRIMPAHLESVASLLSTFMVIALCYWIYKTACPVKKYK